MPDVTVERRSAPRFPIILAAEIVEMVGGAVLHARTSDVSRGGCYVDILNPVPASSMVRARLTRGSEVFEATAQVMYVSPGLGMGLRFEQPLPPVQLAVLDRWLAEAAQNP
jgi:hypothetical protein